MRTQTSERPPSAGKTGRRIRLVVGVAVTLVLLWLILGRIDIARATASVQALSWGTLAAAVALIALSFSAKIARWHVMLSSVSAARPGVSAMTLLASVALNNVLPFRAGDVARAFAFRDRIGAPASALVPLLLLERLLDAAMLVAIAAAIALPMYRAGILPAALAPAAYLGVVVVGMLTVLAVAAGPLAARIERDEDRALGWLPAALRTTAHEAIHVTARQFRGRHALALAGLTALAWTAESGMLAVLAAGMGFPNPVLAGYFAAAAATLATLVPSAPGFFGTFHAAAIGAVSLFGADQDAAAAFAFTGHMLLWLPLTLIGLLALARLSTARSLSAGQA